MPKKAPFKKTTTLPAPGSFASPSQTTTTIDLAWEYNAVTHEGFEIRRNGSTLQYQDGAVFPPDLRSFTDTGLSPETQYSYSIRAVSSLGNSAESTLEATTDEPLPTISVQPSNQTANDGQTATFGVTGSNITTYQWEISTNGGASWADIGGATSSMFTTGVLSASDDGNQYRCKVYNDSLDEVISNAATLTVISATLLAPTNLTATVAGLTQIDLAWTDNATTETAYRIYRNGVQIDSIAADSVAYSDTTVSSGNTYTYRVVAWDGSVEASSDEVSASIGGPEILANPTDEYLAPGGTASFAVAADTTKGSLTYQWEYSDNSGVSWADAAGKTSARIDIAGLTDANSGRLYRCKVSNGVATTTSESATATVYAHTYPLDTYSALGAYGMKKLRTAYAGACIRIAHPDTLAESDIGFDGNGDLDTSAFAAIWAADPAEYRIVTIYDHSPNGNDLTVSSAAKGLKFNDGSGSIFTGRDGKPCFYGQTDGNYPTERYACTLSSPTSDDATTVLMLYRRDDARTRAGRDLGGGEKAGKVLCVGEVGFASNKLGNFSYAVTATSSGSNSKLYTIEREKSYRAVSFGPSVQKVYFGTEQLVQEATNYTVTSGASSSLLSFWCHAGEEISEFVIYNSALSKTDVQNRVLLHNRNWMASNPTTEFDGSEANTYLTWKLLKYVDQFQSTDFAFPSVLSKTANSITVAGRDWSWIQPGATIEIGESITLTVAVGASYSDGNTTIPVNESTASVTVGDECIVNPYWDGSTSDLDVASSIEVQWRNSSNTSMAIGVRPARYRSHWYKLNSSGNIRNVSPAKSACLVQAQPDTAGLDLGIARAADLTYTAEIHQFSLASLTERPTYVALSCTNHSITGTTGAFPYIGAWVYPDTDFDAGTVTWNTSPVPFPTAKDYDGGGEPKQTAKGLEIDITLAVQAAYDGGATSVTVLLYQSNAVRKDTESSRIFTGDFNLLAYEEGCALCPTWNGVRQYQFRGDANHVYGFGRREARLYRHLNLPLAGGNDGNPFLYWHGLARRVVVANIYSLFYKKSGLVWNIQDLRQLGGYLEAFTPVWLDGDLIIDPVTRQLLEDWCVELVESFIPSVSPSNNTWDNANMSCKAVEALGSLWAFLPASRASDRARVIEVAKYALLGKIDGDITTNDLDIANSLLSLEGNVREGNASPIDRALESDYFGRSWAHIFMCRYWTYGSSDWDWLDDVIDRVIGFIHPTSFEDTNGRINGVAYGGRTSGKPNVFSQYNWYSNLAVAAQKPGWYWLARDWATGGDLLIRSVASAIAAATSRISQTSFGKVSSEYPERLNMSFAWPTEVAVTPPVAGWATAIDAAMTLGTATTYMPGTRNNWTDGITTIPSEAGKEDFVLVTKGSGVEKYKAFIMASQNAGGYLGSTSPQLSLFWTDEFGCAIYSKKSAQGAGESSSDAGSDPERGLEDARPYSLWCETVAARTDAIVFSANNTALYGCGSFEEGWQHTLRTRSWDGVDTLTTTQKWDPVSEFTDGVLSADAEWTMTKVFRVLDKGVDGMEGVEIDMDLAYTQGVGGPDQVEELWQIIPLFVARANDTPEYTVNYYNGTIWIPIVSALQDTWLSGAEWIRVDRNYGSGVKSCWIKFDSARSIFLDSLELKSSANNAKLRRLYVNLHPNRGVMTNIPATAGLQWTVTSTDPALTQTGIYAALLNPATGLDLPEGGLWALRAYVNWAEETADTVAFQYSTDYAGDEGAATWNAIGSGSLDGGYYTYAGGTVASSLAAVRVVATSVEASTSTSVHAVTSSAMTTMVSDSFTDTNDVLLTAHTPDTDVVGSGWSVYDSTRSLKVSSNQAAVQSGKSDNGNYNTIDVGSADYLVSADVLTSASTGNTASYPGPYIGGRLISSKTQYYKVKLIAGIGVDVEIRVGDGTDFFTLFDSWTPSVSTTYKVEAQLHGQCVAFRVKSADGLTTHSTGAVWTQLTPISGGENPGIGSTFASDSRIDNVTIKTW